MLVGVSNWAQNIPLGIIDSSTYPVTDSLRPLTGIMASLHINLVELSAIWLGA